MCKLAKAMGMSDGFLWLSRRVADAMVDSFLRTLVNERIQRILRACLDHAKRGLIMSSRRRCGPSKESLSMAFR